VVESELVHELLESLSVVVGGVEDLDAEAERRESSNARNDDVEVCEKGKACLVSSGTEQEEKRVARPLTGGGKSDGRTKGGSGEFGSSLLDGGIERVPDLQFGERIE